LPEGKLKSKKNEVYKKQRVINGETCYVVEKAFSDVKRFYMEYMLHDMLSKSDLTIPRLLDFENPCENTNGKLIYEYIDGDVALDTFADTNLAKEVLDQMIAWMGRFYEITRQHSGEQWILGDAHLRNFIYDRAKEKLYGFDLEEAQKGAIEQDAAKLFLYIATYEPEYSANHLELAEYFLKKALSRLNLSGHQLLKEISNEVTQMETRRSCEIKTEFLTPILERNLM